MSEYIETDGALQENDLLLIEEDDMLDDELDGILSLEDDEDLDGELSFSDLEDTQLQKVENVNSNELKITPNSPSRTMKSFLEASLLSGATKLTEENIALLSSNIFSTHEEVAAANTLREELYSSTTQEVIEFYRNIEANRYAEKFKRLKSHVKSVFAAYDMKEQEYLVKRLEITDSLNSLKSELKQIETYGSDNPTTQVELEMRIKIVEHQYNSLMAEYAKIYIEHKCVKDFLQQYLMIYDSHIADFARYKYMNSALLKNLERKGDHTHTCTCTKCNKTVELHDSKLPYLEVGKYSYSFDISESIKEIYNLDILIQETFYKLCIRILKSGALALNKTEILESLEGKPLKEQVIILHQADIINAIPDSRERATYINTYSTKLNEDFRKGVINLLTMLCLPTTPLPEHMATYFKDRRVPTPLNVLDNKHPLLRATDTDSINRYLDGKHLAYYKKFTNAVEYVEFALSVLDTDFQYPNVNMVYNHRLSNIVSLDFNSFLRLVMPDIHCEHCGALLLLPPVVIQSATSYLHYYMQKSTTKDLQESVQAPLLALLSPAMKALHTSEVKGTESVKPKQYSFYNPKQRTKVHSVNYNVKENTAKTLKEVQTKSSLANAKARIDKVRYQYKLVSEALAIELCEAIETGNYLKIDEILERNAKLIQETNNPQQSQVQESETELSQTVNDVQLEESVKPEEPQNATEELKEPQNVVEEPEEFTMDSLLEEYGDVDLDTLSYEELTSKGFYKRENLLRFYGLSAIEYEYPEEVLIKIMGDEASLAKLPKAMREAIQQNYTFIDAAPENMFINSIIF